MDLKRWLSLSDVTKHNGSLRSHGSGHYFTSDTLIQLDNGYGISAVELRESMWVCSASGHPMQVMGVTIHDDPETSLTTPFPKSLEIKLRV